MPANTKPLDSFESGARVRKPSATRFDFAYGRIGTVRREHDMIGVLWDGGRMIIQYRPEQIFEPEAAAPKPN